MQFKVPQFLDIEDKIFGPFTFNEFVYLAGGAGICYVMYKGFGLLLAIVPMILVASFSLALVFYKPNNKPFIKMLESGFKYYFQDKLYIWKRRVVKKQLNQDKGTEIKIQRTSENSAKLSGDKLRNLAWSLDVLDFKKDSK